MSPLPAVAAAAAALRSAPSEQQGTVHVGDGVITAAYEGGSAGSWWPSGDTWLDHVLAGNTGQGGNGSLAAGVAVDAFAGAGGNVIQLAMR